MERSLHVSDETIADETAALRRLARALLRDRAAADDVVQNTWLAALRRPPATDRPLRPWLARVLRNNVVSSGRSAGRARAREAAAAGASTTDPFDRIDVARQLLEEVARLGEADRELIALVYWDGLSSAECAERLGRPPSTVRTQLQRALTRLRRRLDEERGGRAAWMAALVPFAGVRRSASPLLLGGLGLVGVASIALVVVAPNGCTAERDADPTTNVAVRETPDEVEALPLVSPMNGPSAPDPAAARRPARAKETGTAAAEESLYHPKIGFFMAFREVFGALQECREGKGAGSVRVQVEAVYDGEDKPFVEVVHFEEANNVADTEVECLRQTLLAMDIAAPDPSFGPFRYTPTAVYTFDADGKLEYQGINRGPMMHLFTATKQGDDLEAALAACSRTDGAVELELTFDPDTGTLTDVVTTDDTDPSKCAQQTVRDIVRPTRPFEPVHPEDATMRCSFAVGTPAEYTCWRLGPGGQYVEDP